MEIFKNNKEYSVGLYFRLSKEDGDKSESESISNQRNILKRFCQDNELRVYNEYADDGYSGLNFDRPAFNEMIKDIESNKINMVVTKDLSRLGRDYSEVGKYIERYFPEHNIRYVAIYDEVDTITDTDDMLPLRAVLNDFYCKEASRKFRSMLYNKKVDGKYIAVEAPYGYKKDKYQKGHLVIDELESKIVKRIFDMYINGKGTYQITKVLNNEKILPPAATKKNITTITNQWNYEMVRRILQKEVYVGDTVLGKTKKINYKSKKIINLPESEWIITKNTHDPIISRKDFEIVQRIIRNNKSSKIKKYDYLLKGIVKCKECGNSITWLTKKDKYKDKVTIRRYGVCSTAEREVSVRKCYKKYINYDKLEEQILTSISKVIKVYMNTINYKKIIESESKVKNQKLIATQSKIKEINNKIDEINNKIDTLYIDKLDNVISEMDYTRIASKLDTERNSFYKLMKDKENELKNINELEEIKVSDLKIRKTIRDFCKIDRVTKSDLLRLIDKIYIDVNKNLEIVFTFRELNIISDKL